MMDDEKLKFSDNEEAVVDETVDHSSDADDLIQSDVTAEDVVAAFNMAEQTLFSDQDVNEAAEELPSADETPSDDVMLLQRNDHVMQFKMDFSLDDIPDAEGMGQAQTEEQIPEEETTQPEAEEPSDDAEDTEDGEEAGAPPPKSNGCLSFLIISLSVLLISVALAAFATSLVFEFTGFNRNNRVSEIVIPKGADTEDVASILKEEGLIGSERYFCWYVRLMKLDNKWREGSFSLQADMGYPSLVDTMQAKPPRKTVTVTFPEGMSVPEMAELLEKNKVCSAESFVNAVRYGDYDYDFVRNIPTEADDPAYANRAYRLEGYLFPDTYEFYVDSLGETVVDRMLQNFEAKISKSMLAQIKDNGWTLDQAVIMASMVQGEGDSAEVMNKVARVMHNRLKPNSGFEVFQFCSTRDYANYLLELKWDAYDAEALKLAYNTYYREGLPVGAINNPGLDAFNAILYPSNDAKVKDCYYFATDYKTGITYFSKTEKEHAAVIKKYGIEDIG